MGDGGQSQVQSGRPWAGRTGSCLSGCLSLFFPESFRETFITDIWSVEWSTKEEIAMGGKMFVETRLISLGEFSIRWLGTCVQIVGPADKIHSLAVGHFGSHSI